MTTSNDSTNDSTTTSSSKKNVLFILVDQLRFPRFCYGEDGGLLPQIKEIIGFQATAADNPYQSFFPGFWNMRKNAVVLRQHTIAASACTPSRTTIMTGQYGTRTGVTQTDGLFKSGDAPEFPWLAEDGIPTIGEWFRHCGYRTHYFGKWHVSNPPGHTLQKYGFDDWEESWPEPHGASINNLGLYRDHGFADLACNFLRNQALGMGYNRALAQQQQSAPDGNPPPTTPMPWMAVVSFTNPHDIAAYPALVRGADPDAAKTGPLFVPAQTSLSAPPTAGTMTFPLNPQNFPQENANLPPGVDENLANKPACQFDYAYKMGLGLASKTAQGLKQAIPAVDAVNAALMGSIPFQLYQDPNQAAVQFLQYYAWLIQTVDAHIARVLATLDEMNLRENTVVVFTSDHGEYGAAHNYMMEKWHTAYQEALHVPVVVQSASYNASDEPVQVDALTSHVDMLPTILGLAGLTQQEMQDAASKMASSRPVPPFPGVNLTPVIADPTQAVYNADGTPREGVLFITSDEITEPLATRDPHQTQDNEAFAVYLQVVEAVRNGSATIPNPPHVPKLAPGPVLQPNNVHCVRTSDWKLARYFDPSGKQADQWEMYNITEDECEFTNLLVYNGSFPTPIANLPKQYSEKQIIATAKTLLALLQKLEKQNLTWPLPK